MLAEKELKELFEHHNTICLSIYLPLQWQPDQREANRIRLKNLIKQAEQQLTAVPRNTNHLLTPALELLTNGRLNQPPNAGLVLLSSPGFAQHYFLPHTLPQLVIVGQRFHTKPLLPLLHQKEQFHILALSQNKTRLFNANRHHIKPVTLPDLPQSMTESLAEEYEKQLQYHMGTRETAVYHGHEVSAEKKGAVRRYFRQINDTLTTHLQNSTTPLILACVDYLFPLYQEVNTYPHLYNQHLSGNPDETKPADLQQRAWQLIATNFNQEKTAAAEQYQNLAQTERASANLQQVLKAAHRGRIDTLFTAVGQQQWGHYNPTTGEIHLGDQAEPDTVDLLDETAVHTLLNGGTVYAVDPQEMPAAAHVTAVFRY